MLSTTNRCVVFQFVSPLPTEFPHHSFSNGISTSWLYLCNYSNNLFMTKFKSLPILHTPTFKGNEHCYRRYSLTYLLTWNSKLAIICKSQNLIFRKLFAVSFYIIFALHYFYFWHTGNSWSGSLWFFSLWILLLWYVLFLGSKSRWCESQLDHSGQVLISVTWNVCFWDLLHERNFSIAWKVMEGRVCMSAVMNIRWGLWTSAMWTDVVLSLVF